MTASQSYLDNLAPAPKRVGPGFNAVDVHCPRCNYVGCTYRLVVPHQCPRCKFDRMQWGRGRWRTPTEPEPKG